MAARRSGDNMPRLFAIQTFSLVMALAPAIAQQQADEKVKKFRIYEKTFQISLFPGISTTGISSGLYATQYAVNLFGGVSASNRVFEIGLITNSHFQSSTGIQLAGLANIIGTNAFVNLTQSEERTLVNRGYEVNNKGIQVAGFLNYVLNHAAGIQVSGGLNHVGNHFKGFQLAGIGNSSGGVVSGIQLAGIYNLADESIAGFQLTSFFNYTDGYLSGTQVALINRARSMPGKNSTPHTRARSLQLGVFNFSKEMHGIQVGLINFGGEMRGTQIGLINFFKRYKSKELADAGVPIGLLNIGSAGSVVKITSNEIFLTNIEYTTGNCKNCTWTEAGPIGLPYAENNKKLNQNALILGYDPASQAWGFGWGFQKILLNKASIHPYDKRNELRMISYGVRFLKLNQEWMKVDRPLSLVTRLHLEWGRKGIPPFKSLYKFAGVAFNYFVQASDAHAFPIKSVEFGAGKLGKYEATFWPGYTIGLMM